MHVLVLKAAEAPDRIIGVNQKNALPTHGQKNLTTLASNSGNNFKVSCLVLKNITDHDNLNTITAAIDLRKVSNLNLADPVVDKPNKIDLLIEQSFYTTHIVKSRKAKEGTTLLNDMMFG